jgi:hypothetical protein
MKNTKLDERLERAIDAFFETEPEPNRFELAYSGQTALVSTEPTFSEKAEKWSGIFRQVLVFAPGSFALYFLTLALAYFYPTIGVGAEGIFMFISAMFLTYAGSGNIKNIKNIFVPLSVIAFALLVVGTSLIIFGSQNASLYFWYSIYLFPLVLIAANIIRGLVADEE